jgi:hypothetical protein
MGESTDHKMETSRTGGKTGVTSITKARASTEYEIAVVNEGHLVIPR